MITFFKREDYGMILITELLHNFGKRVVPLSKVAKKHNIPSFFLKNIANDLRKKGIIDAIEGKNGGYKLARNPKDITFGQIIEVLSNKPLFSCCQETGDGKCIANLCPHGFSPRRLANEFLEKIYKKSLEEVVVHHVEGKKS